MIYNIDDVNIVDIIANIPILKRGRGNPVTTRTAWNYKNVICAFDIETSKIKTGSHRGAGGKKIDEHIAAMYIWQFQIGIDYTIIGRTWQQFNDMISDICGALSSDERLLIYVHNLSYEFQFLRDKKILGTYISDRSVFCVKPRTVLKFMCCNDKLEWRCAYLHSNMSLDEFTHKMGVQHQKLSGEEFDYSKYRDADTVLTDREMEYCVNDVIGLVEALYKELNVDDDTLYTIPLTSTGYVRRDVKKALRSMPHMYIAKQLPTFDEYMMLREAFRGGNVHASRYYSGVRINGQIRSMDIASSYPNVQINCKFPISQFYDVDESKKNIDGVLSMIKHHKAVLMRVALWDLHLINEFYPVPYLSRDKCRNILDAEYDNGRILQAAYLETTITDIDLKIIMSMYECSVEVLDCKFANYGYLPDPMRDVIRDYYVRKTKLKNVKGEEVYYTKSKNKLNSVYGMTATQVLKISDCYYNGEYAPGIWDTDETGADKFLPLTDTNWNELYHMAYDKAKPILPYQWGVWTTAAARMSLQEGIDYVGWDRFVYCDTDSVYYIGDIDLNGLNKSRIQQSIKNNACATDIKGVTHYMGVFEQDSKTYKSFLTYGAKKYAYIDEHDELHITIAGVSKESGAAELNKHADRINSRNTGKHVDGLDIMKPDFVFTDAGGTESVYNDEPIDSYTFNGKTFYVPTNIVINESTYKIGLSNDYMSLLKRILDNNLTHLFFENSNNLPIDSLEHF